MASIPQSLWEVSLKFLVPAATITVLTVIVVLLSLAISQNAPIPRVRRRCMPVHLLVVLGSGGHTAEMLYMLDRMPLDRSVYTYRTYVVSSGDNFSAAKAVEFEANHGKKTGDQSTVNSYSIVTIPRARRVHQSYLTAPFSTLQCLWACLLVLRGRYPGQPKLPAEYSSAHPDIIVTNGPAVSVCMVLAAKLIRFLIFVSRWISGNGFTPSVSRLRTIFVESWARVNKLSTSGVLLLPLADAALPSLIEEATAAMGLGQDNAFTKDVLIIEISGPNLPQLTLVDLPGLMHSANKAQSDEDIDVINSLVEEYITAERTIILVVVSAKNDYANQVILKKCNVKSNCGQTC
ncbi:UDP-N-acetylglucosamine transferase subunit alg14 [Penicillium hispanicum]|uniref:UDP-N-acetylglucosamine transferase subunit alg14 n=1 Tax=Penicillium hispanicum TaxID=1080232 RepID=UPI0025400B91|nr:UDP-N-acetylglucosamine transferase subunit alg14 [Penicillium hispanicum]KAJ5585211.1 UDP-N-acetylglucosamine transferase subunit alg14 [Penicillium hispanicum]